MVGALAREACPFCTAEVIGGAQAWPWIKGREGLHMNRYGDKARRNLQALVAVVISMMVGLWVVGLVSTQAPAHADEQIPREYVVSVAGGARPDQLVPPAVSADQFHGQAFRGFTASLTPEQALEVSQQPGVVSVEPNQRMYAMGSVDSRGSAGSWGLDRIDQVSLPLDESFTAPSGGRGVDVYVIDTGIGDLPDFRGRMGLSRSFVPDGLGWADCEGHGTHVAGTVGSSRFGVAGDVRLHAVRVLGCDGSGSLSDVLAGMNWVAASHEGRSVVNMSLGGNYSPSVNTAVQKLTKAGVVVVVAAGNESQDACHTSPASAPSAVTVAASDRDDTSAYFSNYGACVDLFAPGVAISSVDLFNPARSIVHSGTSMASPHVAGAAALYWSLNPGLGAAQISQAVVERASQAALSGLDSCTPNRLVNITFTKPARPNPALPECQQAPPDDPGPPGPPELPVAFTGMTAKLTSKKLVVRWQVSNPGQVAVRFTARLQAGKKTLAVRHTRALKIAIPRRKIKPNRAHVLTVTAKWSVGKARVRLPLPPLPRRATALRRAITNTQEWT